MAWRSLSTNSGRLRSARSCPGGSSRPAFQIHRLWGKPNTRSGALLRYAAGAKIPRHRHEGTEHIYVLIGTQRDERGEYVAGAHVVNPPGLGPHGVQPGRMRGVRGLGAAQHIPRRVALTWACTWAWLGSGAGSRVRAARTARRASRGGRTAGRWWCSGRSCPRGRASVTSTCCIRRAGWSAATS